MRTLSRHFCLVFLSLSWAASARSGEICQYVDAEGVTVYTNVPPSGVRCKAGSRRRFSPAPEFVAEIKLTSQSAKALAPFEALIEESARRHRIPSALVRAVMHAESAFDPNAFSSAGACGLMQLMPQTAKQMDVNDIFDVKQNIEGGVRYLRFLANQFNGEIRKVVAAYNAGPEAVRKFGGKVPPYAETQDYVEKVLKLYQQYKTQARTPSAAR